MDFGIYLHIPFCTVQCPYCTFFTVLRPSDATPMQRFAAALQREWQLRVVPRLERGDRPRTLYLGGGTPSDLPVAVLTQLLASLAQDLEGGLESLDEVTAECNPESAAPELLDALRGVGVGRASLGVQALDPADLATLGRAATVDENRAALREVEARFPTWNADLILGIPGSSAERLADALEGIRAAGAPHVSFYCLELPADRARRLGDPQTEASETWKAELYEWTSGWVESHGYIHYEISNAARPGHAAQHNAAYWSGREYVGLGPGAHSFEAGTRRANRSSLPDYLGALQAGQEPPARREVLTPRMLERERVLLGLRTLQGLDLSRLESCPEPAFLQKLESAGLARLEEGRLRLTPRGWMVSDSIVLQLVAA